MHRLFRALSCLALALSAACGGGGSSGGGAWLTFTPAAPAVTTYLNETADFEVRATSTRLIADPFSALVVDLSGKLAGPFLVTQVSQTEYRSTLTTAGGLAAGTHHGQLQVRLCYDDPRTCARPVDGSPWTVPYTITVKGFDLKPLQPMAGVADWSGTWRDATGNRYVPASLTPAAATRRFWRQADPMTFGCMRDSMGLVTAGRRAFLALGFPFNNGNLCSSGGLIVAFDEQAGQEAWSHDFGQTTGGATLFGPATGDGKVFAVANGRLQALDQATGSPAWSAAPPEGYTFAPAAVTFAGGAVYASLAGTTSGAGYARYASDGTFAWAAPAAYATRPVVAGGLLYAQRTDAWAALDVADGSEAWSVPQVVSSLMEFIALPGGLVCERKGGRCVDTATKAVASFGPVVDNRYLNGADGTVALEWTGFDTPPVAVKVRALDSGALSDVGDGARFGPGTCVGILTDSTVFACSYVFDRATGARSELPTPLGEQLQAISAQGVGYLYDSPTIHAVNLR